MSARASGAGAASGPGIAPVPVPVPVPVLVSSPAVGSLERRSGALARYRAVIAELPLSAEAAEEASGAIVVVDGAESSGWPSEVAAALASGALGVVVDGAAALEAADEATLSTLAASSKAAGRPVVISRRFLPKELVLAVQESRASSVGGPNLVTVELGGALSTGVLRDALGWARVLTGGSALVFPPAPSGAGSGVGSGAGAESVSGSGASVLLASDGGVPVIVTWVQRGGVPWLRASSLGSAEVEVVVDEGIGCASAAIRSATGEQVITAGFEGPARLELRRAIDAVRASAWSDELTGVLEDLRLQRLVQRALAHPLTEDQPLADNL